MKLDYVDIFYSHRWDPKTPLEETMQALVDIVRQGKASVIIGTSSVAQLEDNLKSLGNCHFSADELRLIEDISSAIQLK